ncbi:MAG: baseplate J/gp47 family protein [Proteiniphilum sp.]|nr:baseplate J/gp47 family protein [Proteiniphilum sp.]
MVNCGKELVLTREGADQQERFIEALSPESVKLNEFSLKEWMQFAYRFAAHLNYFGIHDDSEPSGDWQEFFQKDEDIETFLRSVEEGGSIKPHLALYVAFIQLLEFTKSRFNTLTRRHLDFYYQHILQIEKLPPTVDKVHVLFELAKNCVDAQIADGTQLDGGKDGKGQKRIYETDGELIANQVKVVQLRNLYNDHKNSKLKASEKAASFDGVGGDFPNDEVKWWPFGHYHAPGYPELPDAKVGFALASDVLAMREGERNVKLTIEFVTSPASLPVSMLTENLEIWCSGEKGWLGPFTVQPQLYDENGKTIYASELNVATKKITLAFQVPKEEKPVTVYQQAIHGENFTTGLPVCRVLIQTEKEEGHALYRRLVEKEVKAISIDVDVRRIEGLELENDIGTLNASKPFFPFGTRPVKGSNFYLGYSELFKKEWDTFDVEINWKNTPEKLGSYDAFVDLYFAYRTDYLYQASSSGYLDGIFLSEKVDAVIQEVDAVIRKVVEDNSLTMEKGVKIVNKNPDNLLVTDDSYFKALIEIKHREEWMTLPGKLTLFTPEGEGFATRFSVTNAGYETGKNGPARLSLEQSFLHDLFPRIYALTLASEEKTALIPNEPYTPLVENIRLNYTATATCNTAASEQDYRSNPLQLFHEHPFGQSEEHLFMKNQLSFLSDADKKIYPVPTYCKGGELYIGLENVLPQQQVSLLVQVLEGSENPEADTFTGKQKVAWSVLFHNEWKQLDSTYMITNETDNFLKSGIVRFSLPKGINSDGTRLPGGLVWVKATTYKNYDAVCKTMAIHAQVVQARFTDHGNELSHLEKGLEAGNIAKLLQRISTVKGISQPFSSFGGTPRETDAQYYRRVSERLRHKHRAITLWDYEHIVLQEFPEIHKVKCLNHTAENSFLSPGDVMVIVIPDIVNKNVFDIYQPRVSRALLNRVQQYLNQLNSFHVHAVVRNPDYEEVTVALKVKFHEGYDESFYKKQLNEDITRLLSPWAFEQTAEIRFGVTLHRSTVINWIEKLGYVDYVADVNLQKGGEISTKSVSPESPKAILVSARQHKIDTDIKSCTVQTETKETCQS